MCVILKLGKYIAVPILTIWLRDIDLLSLDSALVDRQFRTVYLQLLQEYNQLLLTTVCQSKDRFNYVETCGWMQRFSVACVVPWTVTVSKYDLTREYSLNLMVSVVKSLLIDHTLSSVESDSESLVQFTSMNQLTSLHLFAPNLISRFLGCSKLTSLVINCIQISSELSKFTALLLISNPLLSSVEISPLLLVPEVALSLTLHSKNLRRLRCQKVDSNNKLLCLFLMHCRSPFIEKLDLSVVWDWKSQFLSKCILWHRGKTLTHLRLNLSRIEPYPPVSMLSEYCPRLQSVATNCGIQLPSSLVQAIVITSQNPNDSVVGFCSQNPNTQRMSIEHYHFSDKLLIRIVHSCFNLTRLHLYDCKGLCRGYLGKIAPHCLHITHLRLPRRPTITSKCMSVFRSYFQQLVEINLFFDDYQAHVSCCVLLLQLSSLATLKSHVMTHNRIPDDREYQLFPDINTRSNVTDLQVTYAQSGDVDMLRFLACCPNLTVLSIKKNILLTSEGFAALASCLRKLRVLSLENCINLDDSCADVICASCPRLHTLITTGTQLSPSAVEKIEKSCVGMNTLHPYEWWVDSVTWTLDGY